MTPGRRARERRRPAPRLGRRDALASVGGGLIVLCGPPLAGKNLLAAGLADWLPRTIKLEAIDNLDRHSDYWIPDGGTDRTVWAPELRLLARVRKICERRTTLVPPTLIVAARFASPRARRSAYRTAQALRLRFLLVEARSSEIRALRRIPMSFLPEAEVVRRLDRYRRAMREYEAVSTAEARTLPCLRMRSVLADLDESVRLVLARWSSAV
jgi:hypothetical protein